MHRGCVAQIFCEDTHNHHGAFRKNGLLLWDQSYGDFKKRTFRQRRSNLFAPTVEGTFPYMDDARVGFLDRETHLQHLDKLFSVLAVNGLAINLEKCVFAVPILEFLGHRITAAGSSPPTDHTTEIQNYPTDSAVDRHSPGVFPKS
jgi:hypothetical protein